MSRTNFNQFIYGQAERKVRREQERNGGLSVDDNKGLLFIGIILIIIGLAGLKF